MPVWPQPHIPNTLVKPARGYGTARVTTCDCRSSPGSKRRNSALGGGIFRFDSVHKHFPFPLALAASPPWRIVARIKVIRNQPRVGVLSLFASTRFLETLARLGITHRSLKEEEMGLAEYRNLEEAQESMGR